MVEKQIMEEKLNLVSDKMMILKNNGMKEKYPVSLIDINCWEWPQGVGLFGLYRYYEMSRKPELLTFLTEWYDRRMEEGIVEKNVNTTSPMLTLTYLYEITKKGVLSLLYWGMGRLDHGGKRSDPDRRRLFSAYDHRQSQ